MKILMIFLVLITHAFAVIYGTDDRVDFYQMPSEIQNIAQSSIALVPKKNLLKNGDYYYLDVKTVGQTFKMCQDTLFQNQPLLANCSGVLVSDNRILTAAHCIDKNTKDRTQKDYYAVFNYKLKNNSLIKSIHKDDVFELKEEIYHNFDPTFKDPVDLAIYSLDRKAPYPQAKVNLNPPIVGDKLYVLGYPLGIPLKFADNSEVLSHSNLSFRHHLDTFSVNSGSPIFNMDNEVIGVHVRGTGSNIDRSRRECGEWGLGLDPAGYGEANDLSSLAPFF